MNPAIRNMVQETHLNKSDLIYPLFCAPGKNYKKAINSMPGVYQMSVDNIVKECRDVYELGIPAVILFGIPESKDEIGSGAYDDNGIIQRSIRAIKMEVPKLVIIADVCLCEYTSNGHCGVLDGEEILNDESILIYATTSVSLAEAGADIIAPSDMMDGRVLAIREALDSEGFINMPIMSYAAKYASAYYGPFREAAEGAPKFGDRKSHQMDIA
ncbi:MAG: porphobilinogen synthase, partial [Bacteroidota bacterium]|nr:porphobilinogen synthase [Bacteroidota bacterium]